MVYPTSLARALCGQATLLSLWVQVDAFYVPTPRAPMTMVMDKLPKLPNPFFAEKTPLTPKSFNPVVSPADVSELEDLEDLTSPESLIARTKVALAADLGIRNGNLLADNFICIGPFLENPLNKVDYLAAGRFFDLRSTFPDLDYRAHDYRVDRANPLTVRVTARTVGTMRGELRLRDQTLPPNGQQMRCPPEAISLTFDPDTGKITKLCAGFTMDRLVGNTGGLCGVMAAATVAGEPPSDWEIYPPLTVAQRFFGRPVAPIGESTSFLAPFPETVMVQLAKGILAAPSDSSLLANTFTYMSPTKGPIGKKQYLEDFAEQEFAEVEPEFSHFRVDPYDPNRVWVDVRPLAPGFEGPPQAMSFTFDDDGFCVRITSGFVMDPSLGNAGGLGGPEGYKYAKGQALPALATRPIPQAVGRLQKQILSTITGVGVDDLTVSDIPTPLSRPTEENKPNPVETLSAIKAARPVSPAPTKAVATKPKPAAPAVPILKVPTLTIPKQSVPNPTKAAPPKPTSAQPIAKKVTTTKESSPPKKSASFTIPKIPTLSLSMPTTEPKNVASKKPDSPVSTRATPREPSTTKKSASFSIPKIPTLSLSSPTAERKIVAPTKAAPPKLAAPTIKLPTLSLSVPNIPKRAPVPDVSAVEAQKRAAAARARQLEEEKQAKAKAEAARAAFDAKQKAAAQSFRERQAELKAEQEKQQAKLKADQDRKLAELKAAQERQQAEKKAAEEKLRAELKQRQEEARLIALENQQLEAETARAKREAEARKKADDEEKRLTAAEARRLDEEAKKAATEQRRLEIEEQRAAQAEARRQAEEAGKAKVAKLQREAEEKRLAQMETRRLQEDARKAELAKKQAAAAKEAERQRIEDQKLEEVRKAELARKQAAAAKEAERRRLEAQTQVQAQKQKAAAAAKAVKVAETSKPGASISLFGIEFGGPVSAPAPKPPTVPPASKPRPTINLFGNNAPTPVKTPQEKATEAAKSAKSGATINLFGLGGSAATPKAVEKPAPRESANAVKVAAKAKQGASISLFGLGGGAESRPKPTAVTQAAKAIKVAENASPGASISLFGLGGGAAAQSKPAAGTQAQRTAAVKIAEKAKPRATINLFGLELGVTTEVETKSPGKAVAKSVRAPTVVAPTKPAPTPVTKPTSKPATAPPGVPTLSRWSRNGDGSISGSIRDSPNFRNGERVTTSPIAQGTVASGNVVRTASGSRYFLS